jgi:hypothetical protein
MAGFVFRKCSLRLFLIIDWLMTALLNDERICIIKELIVKYKTFVLLSDITSKDDVNAVMSETAAHI